MTDEAIAHIAHEALRAYAAELVEADPDLGVDDLLPMWELAPEWMRLGAQSGVRYARENPDIDAESQHEEWRRQRADQGWMHGTKKDPELKQHPNMVAWQELPTEQRMKDVLFLAIVRALDLKPSRIHLGGFRG